MTDTPPAALPVARYREHATAALVPFFLDGPDANEETALLAAREIMDAYGAETPRELQLAAQIVATSWATLGCLRTAVGARSLPLEEMLDLQEAALKLERQTRKATKALDTCKANRSAGADSAWDEGAFQLAINRALEKMTWANARLNGTPMPEPIPGLPSAKPARAKGRRRASGPRGV